MVLIDGQPATGVPADDRGLAYGDGAFETLRINAGRAPWIERHLARLATTCAALGFTMPAADQIAADVDRVAAGAARAVVKIIVTRGSGGRGYGAPHQPVARRIVSGHPWPDHRVECWTEGVRLRWCDARLATHAPLPGAKHLNRLTQVLARREWDDPEIAEGLLCDETGAVIEGCMSNLFMVCAGHLVTPSITGSGVAGIARGWILQHAESFAAGAEQRRVAATELAAADELFICNSIVGIWPVRQLGAQRFGPTPVAHGIQRALIVEGLGP